MKHLWIHNFNIFWQLLSLLINVSDQCIVDISVQASRRATVQPRMLAAEPGVTRCHNEFERRAITFVTSTMPELMCFLFRSDGDCLIQAYDECCRLYNIERPFVLWIIVSQSFTDLPRG